jgi:uncharacterized protein (TIGR04255 family)
MHVRLPVKISPCPLVETITEIRFEPSVPAQAVFGLVYRALQKSFPQVVTLPQGALPEAVFEQNPALKYQAHYRLDSQEFSLMVGPRSLAVGTRGEYPGWNTVFPKFAETLSEGLATGVARRVERFGLRFINFFEEDVFPNLHLSFSFRNAPVVGGETFFKTVLDLGEVKAALQVGKDLMLNVPFKPTRIGSIIDIDCFMASLPSGNFLDEEVSRFLDIAHQREKETFFSLLREEFLQRFNPQYE